jgi:hypothetical protein
MPLDLSNPQHQEVLSTSAEVVGKSLYLAFGQVPFFTCVKIHHSKGVDNFHFTNIPLGEQEKFLKEALREVRQRQAQADSPILKPEARSVVVPPGAKR